MPTTPNGAHRTAKSVDEQFIALVLADEQLLEAEFDAIIAHEWASRPPPGRHWGARLAADHPLFHPVVPRGGGHPTRVPPRPGVGGWCRQRSPPGRPAPRAGRPHGIPGAAHHHARIRDDDDR